MKMNKFNIKISGISLLIAVLFSLFIWYNWWIRYTWHKAYPQCSYSDNYVTLTDVDNRTFTIEFNHIVTHLPNGQERTGHIFKEENGIPYIKRFYYYYDDNFLPHATTSAISKISGGKPESSFFYCDSQYEILYGDAKHVPEISTPWFYETPDFVRRFGFYIQGELNGNPSFLSKTFQYFLE